jgi:WD40 repeat protein
MIVEYTSISRHAHRGGVITTTAFTPDGETLATGCDDETIKIWDLGTGDLIEDIKCHSAPWTLAFSPDGKILAIGSRDYTVKVWDGEIRTLGSHQRWIHSIAISPDGKILASGSGDKTMKLWDIPTGKLVHTNEHETAVARVFWSPDGKLISHEEFGNIKVWQLQLL